MNATHTPTPWFVFNMVHEKNGRPMTPEELGEYVKNSVLQSIKDGGASDRFLFVTQAGNGVPDICHVGNGPSGPANAAFIVLACNSYEALSAHNRELVAALEEALPYVSGWTGAVPLAKSPEQAAKCLTRLRAAIALSRGGKT